MKVAIYARYSSDNQRDASIADQMRVCRAFPTVTGPGTRGRCQPDLPVRLVGRRVRL